MIRRSRPRRQWRASGCSWCLAAQGRARRLARRYAREAAQAALSQLEHGASLDEVELPLLTTWDRWTKTPGSTRKSLVTASFASGLGHTDPDGSGIGRLERTFIQPDTRVLMVVDFSTKPPTSQVSHPAARAQLATGMASRHNQPPSSLVHHLPRRARPGPRAAGCQLAEPRVPRRGERLHQAWFATNPRRGDALIHQISAREDLARVAVVPLMSTFYACWPRSRQPHIVRCRLAAVGTSIDA